jgi:UDP-N-acetylglucosamine 2-epimerase
MATWHFPATSKAYNKIWELTHCNTQYNAWVGALGCDGLKKRKGWENRNKLAVMIHPETIHESNSWYKNFVQYIYKKRRFSQTWMQAGNDKKSRMGYLTGGYMVKYTQFENRNKFLKYISTTCDALVGNSSAGIIEMPALGVPTINIGTRQDGREKALSIIQCGTTEEEWEKAFDELYSDQFQTFMKSDYYCPYQGENVAQKIYEVLRGV